MRTLDILLASIVAAAAIVAVAQSSSAAQPSAGNYLPNRGIRPSVLPLYARNDASISDAAVDGGGLPEHLWRILLDSGDACDDACDCTVEQDRLTERGAVSTLVSRHQRASLVDLLLRPDSCSLRYIIERGSGGDDDGGGGIEGVELYVARDDCSPGTNTISRSDHMEMIDGVMRKAIAAWYQWSSLKVAGGAGGKVCGGDRTLRIKFVPSDWMAPKGCAWRWNASATTLSLNKLVPWFVLTNTAVAAQQSLPPLTTQRVGFYTNHFYERPVIFLA